MSWLNDAFKTLRPMWKCCGCGKTARGQREDPGDPGCSYYEPPAGWFRVWRGFRGWDWSCGCTTRGRERV